MMTHLLVKVEDWRFSVEYTQVKLKSFWQSRKESFHVSVPAADPCHKIQ